MHVTINDLNNFDIIRSTFTLIFVIITFIVGFRILLNYFKHKKKVFITVGLALIFLSGGYYANAFSFLSIILFEYAFDPPLYIFLLDIAMPLGLICWIYSIDELLFNDNKAKKLVISVYIASIAYIIYILIALSIDYRLLGDRVPGTIFDYTRTPIVFIFTMAAGFIAAITGLLFARKSLRSDDPNIVWKGRFILISFLLLVSGAFLDGIFVGAYLALKVSIRFMMIASAILYYLGFFLPDWLSKRLIKEE